MVLRFPPTRTVTFVSVLVLLTSVAGFVRVAPNYDAVVTPEHVRFQGPDAFYHARLTAHVTRHYPHRLEHDDLRLHPSGQIVDVYPAFDLLNATIALIVGAGDPTDRTIDIVAAWTPAVLGTLTTAVMGIAGWVMAGPWAGLVTSLLAGFLPGGTLAQTTLGYADHHALEAFLLSLAWLACIILAQSERKPRAVDAASALLGLSSGLYVLTWEGGPLLPSCYALFVGLRILIAHQGAGAISLLRETLIVSVVAVVVIALWSFYSTMVWVSLGLLVLIPLVPLSRLAIDLIFAESSERSRRLLWIASLVVVAIATYVVVPETIQRHLHTNIGRLVPSRLAQTVSEMRPLYSDLSAVHGFFGIPLWWVIPGLALGVHAVWKRKDQRLLLPLLLGPLLITFALLQTRFSATASLFIALLNALAITECIALVGRTFERRKRLAMVMNVTIVVAWTATAGVWSVQSAFVAARTDRGPEVGWMETMAWLREHVPSPLSIEDDSTAISVGPSGTSHGVLNWWDSGYYLVHLAGQRPVSNPTQSGASWSARLFLDTAASSWAAELRNHTIRYIVVDGRLSYYPRAVDQIRSQFPSLLVWAGRDMNEYVRVVYFRHPDGRLEGRFVYLPAYFQSALQRLILYGGSEYDPPSGTPWVIQVSRQTAVDGAVVELMESGQAFRSYEDAQAFLDARNDPSWMLVSFSPYSSPVRLSAMPDIERAYDSPTILAEPPGHPRPIPAVSVFHVRGNSTDTSPHP